jgi:hypothetical protein
VDYVDLSRQFAKFEPSDLEEDQLREALWAFRGRDWELSWPNLLDSPYVVVLGEAGIGKTDEFKNQADQLRKKGEPAFFVPIESLLADSLETSLEVGERRLLSEWINGDQEATLFLDAVDDAKLTSPTALATALRRLQAELEPQWSRVRLVLSCRVSDWKPTSDHSELAKFCTRATKVPKPGSRTERLFGLNRENAGTKPPFSVFRMLPLSTEQLRTLAQHYRVNDLEQFMTALEDTDLERVAGRPRDLERLVTYWNKHSRFGSYREMLEYSITTRLVEEHGHIGEKRPLTSQQARQAVERVAAAMLLCQSFRVRVPDPALGTIDEQAPALEVVDVLLDLTQVQQTALLERPIFDPATYGRVRFHDREILEYLAACWFKHRLHAGATVKRIRDLFLPAIYGRSFCPLRITRTRATNPRLRGALPWLAADTTAIRRSLLAVDPSLLLLGGDPQHLSFKVRQRAFRTFCRKYRDRRGLNWLSSRSEIKKVAQADMAAEVALLLRRYTGSDSVRLLLLDVIEAGVFTNAEQELRKIVHDGTEQEHLRTITIDVLAKIGSLDAKRSVATLVEDDRTWTNAILGSVIACVYPRLMQTQAVLDLISRSAREISNASTSLPRTVEEHVVPHCPNGDLSLLIQGLMDLFPEQPSRGVTGNHETPTHFWWIPNALVAALIRSLSNLGENESPSELQLSATEILMRRASDRGDHFLNTGSLDDRIRENRTLKRGLLIRNAVQCGYEIYRSSGLIHTSPTRPNVEDAPWIIEQLGAASSDQQREFWFDHLLIIWRDSDKPDTLRAEIDGIAEKYGALRPKADAWFNPPPSPMAEHQERWKHEEEARRLAEAQQVQENRRNLEGRIADIRSGNDLDAIRALIAETSRLSRESRNLLGVLSPDALRSDYGDTLVDATRSGLKRAWRRLPSPPPPSTGRISWDNYVALVGIRLDVEDGLDFGSLSESEAELAARFALQELNGFPDWIDRLAEQHGAVLIRVFREQIESEMRSPEESNYYPPLLSDLSHASLELAALSAPAILEMLDGNFKPNGTSLRYGFDVIMSAGIEFKPRLARLSELRVHQHTVSDDPDHLVLWMRSWLYAEPEPAWSWIEQLLSGDGPQQYNLAIRFASAMDGSRSRMSLMDDRWNLPARILKRMIPVFVRLVNPKGDIWHEGTYSPGPRDAAQDFRNALFQKLARIPGRDADQALWQLAANPRLDGVREFIVRRIEEHRQNDARRSPWTPAQVVAFEERPRTDSLWSRHVRWVQSHPWPVIFGFWSALLAAILALVSGLYWAAAWLLCNWLDIVELIRAYWPF